MEEEGGERMKEEKKKREIEWNRKLETKNLWTYLIFITLKGINPRRFLEI